MHALAQAEDFYSGRCFMQNHGPDSNTTTNFAGFAAKKFIFDTKIDGRVAKGRVVVLDNVIRNCLAAVACDALDQ